MRTILTTAAEYLERQATTSVQEDGMLFVPSNRHPIVVITQNADLAVIEAIPSVLRCIIPKNYEAEILVREKDGWKRSHISGKSDILIPELHCSIPLHDLYEEPP